MKYRIWRKYILNDGRVYEYPTNDIFDTHTEALSKCPEKINQQKGKLLNIS